MGQPTTLHIVVKADPMPEINWTKDGEPINYPIQQDGSLYIRNTSSDDQGCYTVTATNSDGGKSSQTIHVVVFNPKFVPCKLCSNIHAVYSYHCFTADAGKMPIKVEDFAEHFAMLQSNMYKQFRIDYESLVSETEYTFHAARLAVNMNKNRYRNILPCNLIYYL